MAIRNAAKSFSESAIKSQLSDMSRWGLMANWNDLYRTSGKFILFKDKSYEKSQLKIFAELVRKNLVYHSMKPVFWSPSSKTALAEAEIEYNDSHESTAVFSSFKIEFNDCKIDEAIKDNLYAIIWTTTPWTLTANQVLRFLSIGNRIQ